jgi:hypothetical protein
MNPPLAGPFEGHAQRSTNEESPQKPQRPRGGVTLQKKREKVSVLHPKIAQNTPSQPHKPKNTLFSTQKHQFSGLNRSAKQNE